MNKLYKSTIMNHDHCNNTYKCPHMMINKHRDGMATESDIQESKEKTGIKESQEYR